MLNEQWPMKMLVQPLWLIKYQKIKQLKEKLCFDKKKQNSSKITSLEILSKWNQNEVWSLTSRNIIQLPTMNMCFEKVKHIKKKLLLDKKEKFLEIPNLDILKKWIKILKEV